MSGRPRFLLLALAGLPAFAGIACGQLPPTAGNEASCLFQAGPEAKACEVHTAAFRQALPRETSNQVRSYTTVTSFGPGWNFGPPGGWRVQKNEAGEAIFAARGIHQYLNGNIACHATGDCALIYGWGYSDGGVAAQGDEGVTLATLEGGETSGYFHGTIAKGSRGAQEPTLNFKSGNHWTTDGAFLLDISKGTLAGSLRGESQPVTQFNGWLNYLPITGVMLPLTEAWGRVISAPEGARAIPASGSPADQGKAVHLQVRLGTVAGKTPAFRADSVVCVAGSEFPEQARLLAADPPKQGTQNITVELRNPNQEAAIFQGGVCGQFISLDADLKLSGYRTSYYAFGSLTGTDLIYGSNMTGGLGKQPIPDPSGSDPATSSGPRAGFHLYPGAEIVSNRSLGTEPTLEPNTVDWQPGDEVENPHYPLFGGSGLWIDWTQHTPTSRYFKAQAVKVDLNGEGISGSFRPISVYNANPLALYRAGGGPLSAPALLYAGGAFGDLVSADLGPQPSALGGNAVISIRSTAAGDNTPFNLFDLVRNRQLHGAQISYDPATAITSFDFVRANGYLAAPVLVTTQGTPGSSATTCVPNSSWDDDNYHYHCLSTGKSIKRIALSSF